MKLKDAALLTPVCILLYFFCAFSVIADHDGKLMYTDYSDIEFALEYSKAGMLWSALYNVEVKKKIIIVFTIYNVVDGNIIYETAQKEYSVSSDGGKILFRIFWIPEINTAKEVQVAAITGRKIVLNDVRNFQSVNFQKPLIVGTPAVEIPLCDQEYPIQYIKPFFIDYESLPEYSDSVETFAQKTENGIIVTVHSKPFHW